MHAASKQTGKNAVTHTFCARHIIVLACAYFRCKILQFCKWKTKKKKKKQYQQRELWIVEIYSSSAVAAQQRPGGKSAFIHEYSYVQFVSYYLLLTRGTFSFVRVIALIRRMFVIIVIFLFIIKVHIFFSSYFKANVACCATKIPKQKQQSLLYSCYSFGALMFLLLVFC